MSDLTGLSISSTYNRLLALPSGGGSAGSPTTLLPITDGDEDVLFALQISSAGVHSTGTMSASSWTGILDITDTTDASDDSGDTGALRCEGGASIAKKLYVGTDLAVDGVSNLDVTNVVGALTVGIDGTSHDVIFYGDEIAEYFKWDQANNQLELRGDSASLLVGDQTITAGTDPMISISRTTDTASANAHGFEDYTKFKKVGSYNAYDARATIPAGAGNNYTTAHFLGFQAGQSYDNADGLLGSGGAEFAGLGGYWSLIGSTGGCTVTHAKHFLVSDANLSGTTTNQYGLYAHSGALTSATNNYIIYNDDSNGKLYQKGATDLYGALTAVRAAVTNLTDDASIPITSTCVNIDANGGARTGIRFAGTGAAGQIIIVNNTGGETLTFHATPGTCLVRGMTTSLDTMESLGVYMFVSDGALWNLIGGGALPNEGLTAS